MTIRQDLVDNARSGDRIVLTGIVRVEQESVTGVTRGHSGYTDSDQRNTLNFWEVVVVSHQGKLKEKNFS